MNEKEKKYCPYCDFEENEYFGNKELNFKLGYLSDCSGKDYKNDNIREILIHENYEYERFIGIEVIKGGNIFIDINYCPMCGRKL